ncbi:hypothetical protein KF146_0212 [Lactococcus lactis subsp. lactis]|nr:hypothetical protein KF134_1418 [Lactococcus lactis subsp. lactis]KST97196.1 hypothetical protein KF196_2146 [Lactococcus lactis subsp. lactis]KST97693.1 hypothetical protein KF146_0212 [Lactococcus lactis subsp. lactis]
MLIITKNRHFNSLSVILNHLTVIFLLTELFVSKNRKQNYRQKNLSLIQF